MNTPTQEQIYAALRYADDKETSDDNNIMDAWEQQKCLYNLLADRFSAASAILAAAYREKCEECKMMDRRYAAAKMHHVSQIDELKNELGRYIQLYNDTSMKLETAMFGPESGEETYAKVKAERDALKQLPPH